MALVFYYSPMTSATRIHWGIEELGVPYEKVKLDLKAGDQRKPDYLKINPNGKVPAIVDDGTPMFESLAILLYLGDKYGVKKGLWPASGTKEWMEALTWTSWGTVTLATHIFRYLLNTSDRFPAEDRHAGQAAMAKKDVESCLQILSAHLEGRAFMLGDAFSLVDVATASMTVFLARVGIDVSGYPRVAEWSMKAMQRPAMARAAAG